MVEQNKYNGWTNYETWLVNLWLNNEEESERELRHISRMSKSAEKLREWVQDMVCEDGGSLKGDLINTALNAVNWQEIVETVEKENELE